MRILLKFLLGTTLVVIAIAALMLVPSPQPKAPKPWEVTVMPDNQIEVMGVHLGTTTYGEIQQLWREAGQEVLQAMAERALSAKLQPSGARRYDPAFDDKQALLSAPAAVLTYIPSVRLDEEMVRTRFGEPEQIHNEAEESPAQIWLYPNIGLTIRLHPEERPVLTYTARTS